MPVDVSICVVSTRGGPALARLLDSLARQKLSPSTVAEVVVVDADPAGAAASSEARPPHAGALPIAWHREPGASVAAARNRGVLAAKGRWAGFIDEDAVADEGWIAAYMSLADELDADGFFGPVLPRSAAPAGPGALDVSRFYAERRPPGATFAPAGAYTANALVRRSLLQSVPFDPEFARARAAGADCVELALRRGDRFYWCDRAHVHEIVPADRHRLGYLTLRVLEGAAAWSHLPLAKARESRARQLVSALVRIAAAVLRLPVACACGRAAAFHAWLDLCVWVGRLHGLAGGRVEASGR